MADVVRKDFLDGTSLKINKDVEGQTLLAAFPLHSMAFKGKQYDEEVKALSPEEQYDLIIVGSGISGLSAAYFYQKKFGKDKKILILDCLAEFGGHAKRDEFNANGKLILGYGGSESFQSPKSNWSEVCLNLVKELGIDIEKFHDKHFQHSTYPSKGLSKGSFFDSSKFGKDVLVKGDPTGWVSDDILRGNLNERSIEEFVNDFPLSEEPRAQLLSLYTSKDKVTLGHLKNQEEKIEYLSKTSYVNFLKNDWKLNDEAIGYFSGRTLDFFGLPPTMVSALDAGNFGYPGIQGIDLPKSDEAEGELNEPYIYHFPDGNASLARILVRSLIPSVFKNSSNMEDIVTAKCDHDELDNAKNSVRIRLNSTVVRSYNKADGVDVAYTELKSGNKLHLIHAKKVILGGFSMGHAYIVDGQTDNSEQIAALKKNVKAPLVYTNVLVKNWHPWVKLGVHEIYGVQSFHSRVKLDYPVVFGDYSSSLNPDQPVLIHMVHVPSAPDAKTPRESLRLARKQLFTKKFEDFEAAIRNDLSKMLGPGGFKEDDIMAITVNRWSHGYSYGANSLEESEEEAEKSAKLGRKPIGNIVLAGSDAGWYAYAHSAIDQAHRAVDEL